MEPTAGISPPASQLTIKVGGFPGELGKVTSRFHGDGVRYRAKLIGLDPVPDAEGKKMCLDSMMKLKGFEVSARKQGRHKQKVWLKISSTGLKILDERSGSVIHDHERNRISSLTEDKSDPRGLAYIYRYEDSYVLFFIKTANLAHPVILDIQEVCQNVNQEIPQSPAVIQNTSPVIQADISPPLILEIQAENTLRETEQVSAPPKEDSSSRALFEVFSSPALEPLPPQENDAAPPELPQQNISTPQQNISTAQILSMFPAAPVGTPFLPSSAYPPTGMTVAQQGPLENHWAGTWNPGAAGSPAWPPMNPVDSVAPPAGGQPQVLTNSYGFMYEGSSAVTPAAPVLGHAHTHTHAVDTLWSQPVTIEAQQPNRLNIESLL